MTPTTERCWGDYQRQQQKLNGDQSRAPAMMAHATAISDLPPVWQHNLFFFHHDRGDQTLTHLGVMKPITLIQLSLFTTAISAHWRRASQPETNLNLAAAGNNTVVHTSFASSQELDPYTRCASNPTLAQRRVLDQFAREHDERQNRENRVVEVYVHVVSTQSKRARYNNAMLQNQITVMNDAFQGTGFSFELVGFDSTVNEAWAKTSSGSREESDMKQALHRGRYQDLNLYFLSDLGGGLLGICYFPTSNPSQQMRILDGCINLADSMPGGAAKYYDLGLTAVHEVGHVHHTLS
ncbi:hypothetical protein BST61_g3131 [Cercospora zeina]